MLDSASTCLLFSTFNARMQANCGDKSGGMKSEINLGIYRSESDDFR